MTGVLALSVAIVFFSLGGCRDPDDGDAASRDASACATFAKAFKHLSDEENIAAALPKFYDVLEHLEPASKTLARAFARYGTALRKNVATGIGDPEGVTAAHDEIVRRCRPAS